MIARRTIALLSCAVICVLVGLRADAGTLTDTEQLTVKTYDRVAAATTEQLDFLDKKTIKATRTVSTFPGLVVDNWIGEESLGLWTKVMLNNPMLYAVYLGFGDGDFYELVNVQSSPVVGKQLRTLPEERWVSIVVQGEGKNRTRTYHYYNDSLEILRERSEPSDYDASKRHWYMRAGQTSVVKTGPYQFQHLQSPGVTYSIRVPGHDAVVALDIALSSLSAYLRKQLDIAEGELYLYQQSGDMIATNLGPRQTTRTSVAESFVLTATEQSYVQRIGRLRTSNEMDWAPFDYAVAGQPYGYTVSVLQMIGELTGLQYEFVNGYTWDELQALYQQGELDVLQPVALTSSESTEGLAQELSYELIPSVAMRRGRRPIRHWHDLEGKTIALPKGWATVPKFQAALSTATIIEMENLKASLFAVAQGTADFTIDDHAVLRYTIDQYFIDDIEVQNDVDWSGIGIEGQQLHWVVQPAYEPAFNIMQRALNAIGDSEIQRLRSFWLRTTHTARKQPAVVPYKELIACAEDDNLLDAIQPVTINDQPRLLYVSTLDRANTPREYLGLVVDTEQKVQPPSSQPDGADSRLGFALMFGVLIVVAVFLQRSIFA